MITFLFVPKFWKRALFILQKSSDFPGGTLGLPACQVVNVEKFTGEATGTGPVAVQVVGVPGPAIVGPPKNPCPGWSHNCPDPKTPVRGGLTIACSGKPLSGVVSQLQNRRPGPGNRGPAGDRVLVFSENTKCHHGRL